MNNHPFEIARDASQLKPHQRTLQDFRNELQELSFRELHRSNITGETYTFNRIEGLIRKLDTEYGTEHQTSISTIEALKVKERTKAEPAEGENISLF